MNLQKGKVEKYIDNYPFPIGHRREEYYNLGGGVYGKKDNFDRYMDAVKRDCEEFIT